MSKQDKDIQAINAELLEACKLAVKVMQDHNYR